ncbi:hypothetical protein HHI36_014246 [Cryptolaemus montrouzieri]|uniref:Uncharacterized protein n=1 Tax=Cryptolaemus montrouzieri TaxID=559131 RepID=A0ABD2N363_9CUCU
MYLDFLQNHLPMLLADVPEHIRLDFVVSTGWSTGTYSYQVRKHLNHVFPNKWIGRGGPVRWPARSPDLTSLDFFLWGYIKGMVYQIPSTTQLDMRQRILDAFQSVSPQMLSRVQRSFLRRIELCQQRNGSNTY